MSVKRNRILITGGSGFIGANFIINQLLNTKNIILNLDKLTYASSLNSLQKVENNSNYQFIKGDIGDNDLVNKIIFDFKPTSLINFAAESHVDNSIKNPDIFIKSNINGVINLLNIAYSFWMHKPFKLKEKYKHARFHQISTDEVYGSIEKGSFNENSRYAPNSPYSASKASADLLVRSYQKTYGLNTSISICSNNFGPNQHREKFFPKVIDSLVNNKPIPVYGDGKNIRDWIYVENHCKAIDLIFNNSKPGSIYNIGGEFELTNLELIELIYKKLNTKIDINKRIQFINDRYGHDFRYSLNIKKIKNELGWKTIKDFDKNTDNYINLLLNKKSL